MPSRLTARPVIVTAAAAVAIFVAVLALLAVRMADGRDPALGAAANQRTPSVTHAQAPAVPQAEVEPPAYDDGGYQDYEDDGASGDADVAPVQPAPAPVQSGTS